MNISTGATPSSLHFDKNTSFNTDKKRGVNISLPFFESGKAMLFHQNHTPGLRISVSADTIEVNTGFHWVIKLISSVPFYRMIPG